MTNLLSANVFLSSLQSVGMIAMALAVLMLMVTIHEFGHYSFGKLLGFKINEFAIGFGKAIYSKTKQNGEKFSVRLLPLGGYCAFEGEDKQSDNKDAFNNKEPWKRIIVLFGGVLFNFLSAILFSVVLLAVMGNGSQQQIVYTEGANANILQTNDIIREVNGEELSYLNGSFAGLTSEIGLDEDVTLVLERNGETITVVVQKYEVSQIDAVTGEVVVVQQFGVGLSAIPLSIGQSLLQAVPFTANFAWESLQLLVNLFTGQLSLSAVGGPITTVSVVANAATQSWYNMLLILPLVAISLAVFNILPIPALDGARIVFVIIEWIRGKPINRNIEANIHAIGLMLLLAFIVIVDINHFL